MINLQLCWLIAACAFSYSVLLTDPGQMLNGIYKFLDQKVFIKNWMKKWLFKPIMSCERCVSGQWAFWLYFYFKTEYSIVQHLFFTLLTILFVTFIGLIYKILDKNTN